MARRRITSERRRWQRLPLTIPVFVRGVDERGNEFLEFSSLLNISRGGALLAIRRYLPRRSQLSLEIPFAPMPRVSLPPHSLRTLRARVVRVTHSEGCQLLGLRFARALA